MVKVKIFSYGISFADFESALHFLHRVDGVALSEKLNDFQGVSVYAAGVHIINLWLFEDIPEAIDALANNSLLFRLVKETAEFSIFEGEIDILDSPK